MARRLARWGTVASVAYFFDPTSGARRRQKLGTWTSMIRHKFHVQSSQMPTDVTDLNDLKRAFEERNVQLVEHRLSEAGDILCGGCRTASGPSEMKREFRHRLEGPTDPSATATVSGLRCPRCAVLGVLVLPYGPQASAAQGIALAALQHPATDSLTDALARYA